MTEPILSPDYWRQRLEQAKELHQAVFRCPLDRWQRIEARHRKLLSDLILPHDSILDAGCGWGRLLTLLPKDWDGRYLGVDLSPDFVALAQQTHPRKEFVVGDLRRLDFPDTFDWAVCISIRPMMKRNLGEDVWNLMEQELIRVSRRVLFLEYDEEDKGDIL